MGAVLALSANQHTQSGLYLVNFGWIKGQLNSDEFMKT